jgi:hypothetical protein
MSLEQRCRLQRSVEEAFCVKVRFQEPYLLGNLSLWVTVVRVKLYGTILCVPSQWLIYNHLPTIAPLCIYTVHYIISSYIT